MKLFCLVVAIFACGFASAQQLPAPSTESKPGISVLRPEFAPPAPRPDDAKAAESPVTAHELRELIRAQTEAIRVLSSKVDSLEDRLRRIEGRLR